MKIDTIADGFIWLLKTNPYEKITIRQICDRAHISRNTFYYYFDNKESLVEWICCRDFMKFVPPYFYIRKENIITKSFFSYILENKEFYNAIYSTDDGHLLRRCLEKSYASAPALEKNREKILPPYNKRKKIHPKIFRRYSCTGIAAVVLFWIGHGMKMPIEDIARDLRVLISLPLEDIWDNQLF
jgi:hypothetical protein